tara:strand:+ start:775 stop:1356 length:582 start_codon:yes stop_codon:yes gene_type:complete
MNSFNHAWDLTKQSQSDCTICGKSLTFPDPHDKSNVLSGSDKHLGCVQHARNKLKKEDPCWDGYKQIGMKKKNGKKVPNCVPSVKKSACECDTCNTLVKALLSKKSDKPFHGYNPNKHSREGGLNAKGRAKAKRETGANLKPPVTEKPSSLKPGSKKANRRKSFCARMGGVKGPTSKEGKLTPKGASLKRWNC